MKKLIKIVLLILLIILISSVVFKNELMEMSLHAVISKNLERKKHDLNDYFNEKNILIGRLVSKKLIDHSEYFVGSDGSVVPWIPYEERPSKYQSVQNFIYENHILLTNKTKYDFYLEDKSGKVLILKNNSKNFFIDTNYSFEIDSDSEELENTDFTIPVYIKDHIQIKFKNKNISIPIHVNLKFDICANKKDLQNIHSYCHVAILENDLKKVQYMFVDKNYKVKTKSMST